MKKFLIFFGSFVLLFNLFFVTQVEAFEAKLPDRRGDVNLEKETKDLYTAGKKIDISGQAKGDIILIGGEVSISSPEILGSIFIGGEDIKINSVVHDYVQIAGEKVELTGFFYDDVFIFGSDVKIQNAQISGDLKVYSGKLTLENSTVFGDLKGNFSEHEGDLRTQVLGNIDISASEDWRTKVFDVDLISTLIFKLPWEVGSIVFLILISVYLGKRNRLEMPEIQFGKYGKVFGKNVLRGILSIVTPAVVLIFSILTLTFFQVSLITTTFYIFLGLSGIFLPIYLANLFKNTLSGKYSKKLNIKYLIAIAYVLISLVGLIPYIGSAITAILNIANFGFLVKMFRDMIHVYFDSKSDQKTTV